MSDAETNKKFNQGQVAIYRSELFRLLQELPPDRLEQLQAKAQGMISDLKSSGGSPLQSGFIEAYEFIEFHIRNRKKYRHGTDTSRNHPYFICRKCETSIIIYDFTTDVCPTCETARWLELVYV